MRWDALPLPGDFLPGFEEWRRAPRGAHLAFLAPETEERAAGDTPRSFRENVLWNRPIRVATIAGVSRPERSRAALRGIASRKGAVMNSVQSAERTSVHSLSRVHPGRVLALLVLLAAPAAAGSAAGQDAQRYVQAGSSGATLYNLPDPKGHVVLEVPAGTPLAVHDTYAGGRYLKVAAPGGVKVWVYGKYVKESARQGWVEITGSYINMRPRPTSQDSYPVGRLDLGDRLRFIRRDDPSKPLADDWVQVYSTPDTLAYVLAAETAALPAGTDAAKRWEEATAKALAAREQGGAPVLTEASHKTAEGSAGATKLAEPAPKGVFEALAVADRRSEEELASDRPDFAAVIAAYEKVLAMGPDAPTRSLVEQRIETAKAHQEYAQLRRDIELADAERQKKLDEANDKIEEMNRGRDPHWGRFQTRGWLERIKQDGEKVYLVRWGSEYVARVVCNSGRYDLDLLRGFELGVQGTPLSAAPVGEKSYPVIDVDRIEVISARFTGHGR